MRSTQPRCRTSSGPKALLPSPSLRGIPGGTYVHQAVEAYSRWLQESRLPKLLVKVKPGAIITPEVAEWVEDSFPNTESVDVGRGIHFIREDHPREIGDAVAEWLTRILARPILRPGPSSRT